MRTAVNTTTATQYPLSPLFTAQVNLAYTLYLTLKEDKQRLSTNPQTLCFTLINPIQFSEKETV